MSLKEIESRRFTPSVDGDLEYNAIVNLTEHLDPREGSSELERTSKAYFCDSRLRSPGDSVCKYGINSVKINDSIAELISDAAALIKRPFNSLMPEANSWMERVEPAALLALKLWNAPTKDRSDSGICVEGLCASKIVRSVDKSLEGVIELAFLCAFVFVVAFGFEPFFAE